MKSNPDKVQFTFKLTARQAQTLFSVVECFIEERPLYHAIWRTAKQRKEVTAARRRYSAQLNQQYRETGVEV